MDCRPRGAPDARPPPTTLAERLIRLKVDIGRWVSRIGCNPTAFGLFELLVFCMILALVYYIDVHRGPVFEWPGKARERESERERDLRIRREVAGYSDGPRDHRLPPLRKPIAKVPISDCEECAQKCSAAPDCISYECDKDKPECHLTMKPPEPVPSKCSGIEIDLLEGGRTTSSKRLNYYCPTDKEGKESGWTIWGWPSRHPATTAAILLVLLFYAIISWFFVYARSTNPSSTINPSNQKPFTFGTVWGKATVSLLGFAAGAVMLGLGVGAVGALMNAVMSLIGKSGGTSTSKGDAGKTLLNFAMAIGGIGLLYLALRPFIDENTRGPYARLLKNLILYLPCLLIQLADWLAKEWRIAPHGAWVLLGIEAIFVGLRFLWPVAENALVNHDGKRLLDKPVYLDVQRSLGTFEMLHVPHGSKKPKFRYSYALSAWFTLNPQPPNARAAFSRYTPILNYGGKPTVSYNMQTGTLRVRSDAGEGPVTVAEVTGLALQTWNNIVINNDAGTMDVFLNGELIGSQPGISPFMRYEEVLAGETRGLEGGICNVVYHPEPMSQRRIRMGYKMLRDRFPPTFN